MAGYKLLIIIAAILQYCSNLEELKSKRRDVSSIDRSLTRCRLFLGSISSQAFSVSFNLFGVLDGGHETKPTEADS